MTHLMCIVKYFPLRKTLTSPSTNVTEVAEATEQRKEEHSEFLTFQTENNAALQLIEKAKNALNKFASRYGGMIPCPRILLQTNLNAPWYCRELLRSLQSGDQMCLFLVGPPPRHLTTPVNNIEYFPPNFEGLVLFGAI